MNRFKAAWNALVHSGSAAKSVSEIPPVLIDPATHRTPDEASWFWETSGGQNFYFKYLGHDSSLKAYTDCPPVNAIINGKAQCYINGKTFVLNTQGKEAGGEAAKKIRALLKKPNPFQSGRQFEAQGYIYVQMFGYSLVLMIKPVGFKDNIDASSMWNIPPSMVDIEETEKLFYQTNISGSIKEIVLNYKGKRTILDMKDIFIIKDFTPSFDSIVIPKSRMCAIEKPINNIIGAYDSRNVLINYRGALGIFTQDSGSGTYTPIAMTKTDKDTLQADLRKYGLRNSQIQFIITNASLKWQQIGVATKDLMLFEEVEGSTMAICDVFKYPYRLMAAEKSASYNDVREFKALLYQDAIIPEAESICEQWNELFKTDEYNLDIQKDYTHVAVLQQDAEKSARARKTMSEGLEREFKNNLITLNRWLELIGEDTRPDGDVYYNEMLAQGMQFGNISVNPQGQLQTSNNGTETQT